MKRLLLLGILGIWLSACSSTKYCERTQDFEGVRQDPPLKAPPGLEVPEPDPSFVIPQVSTQAQAAALNKDRPCLEIPPRLRGSTEVQASGQ